MEASKNISLGERITNLSDLVRLAKEKKSIVIDHGFNRLQVKPAAFIINWRLIDVANHKIHYSVKK